MPIRKFIGDGSFSPEVLTAMSTAFAEALNKLELTHRDDAIAQLVASKIIEAAKTGEHDPGRLCAIALDSIRQQ